MPEVPAQRWRGFAQLTWKRLSFFSPSVLKFVHLNRPLTRHCYSHCLIHQPIAARAGIRICGH
jgi:hypothetical protein